MSRNFLLNALTLYWHSKSFLTVLTMTSVGSQHFMVHLIGQNLLTPLELMFRCVNVRIWALWWSNAPVFRSLFADCFLEDAAVWQLKFIPQISIPGWSIYLCFWCCWFCFFLMFLFYFNTLIICVPCFVVNCSIDWRKHEHVQGEGVRGCLFARIWTFSFYFRLRACPYRLNQWSLWFDVNIPNVSLLYTVLYFFRR